jgi:hypothetical protein
MRDNSNYNVICMATLHMGKQNKNKNSKRKAFGKKESV